MTGTLRLQCVRYSTQPVSRSLFRPSVSKPGPFAEDDLQQRSACLLCNMSQKVDLKTPERSVGESKRYPSGAVFLAMPLGTFGTFNFCFEVLFCFDLSFPGLIMFSKVIYPLLLLEDRKLTVCCALLHKSAGKDEGHE